MFDAEHRFTTTHWSVVLEAGAAASPGAAAALQSLCQSYWYPLYAFVRRKGHSPHDAQDLTQEFFEFNETKIAKLESGDLGPGWYWRDWLIAQVLMSEAKALLESKSE